MPDDTADATNAHERCYAWLRTAEGQAMAARLKSAQDELDAAFAATEAACHAPYGSTWALTADGNLRLWSLGDADE